MRIALGTVQFGLDYGAFNREGQVPREEAQKILDWAAHHDVGVIDTAYEYGSAEATLGTLLPSASAFRVVTKTKVLRAERITTLEVAAMRAAFEESLSRLRVERVHALLSHRPSELLSPGGELLWAEMEKLRSEGRVGKIGVSAYTGFEIDQLLARFPLEIVQVPLNVFDQRLIQGGQLRRLADRGVEVHVRSAFLQGLLLASPSALPAGLESARRALGHYFAEIAKNGLTPLEAALHFLAQVSEVAEVVVGVQSLAQLQEIEAAFRRVKQLPAFSYASFAQEEERVLNPALWARRE